MKDAWLQHHELLKKFTIITDIRSDLRVKAHACDRSVELVLIQDNPNHDGRGFKGAKLYHSTGHRNVGTLRELANAILEACDFVDASNPKWAADGEAWRASDHRIVWKE